MTTPNPYTSWAKEQANAEFAKWLQSNTPVTKDTYSGGGQVVWKTIPDGKGGTLKVRSMGAEDRAYQRIRDSFNAQARSKAAADREAAGWQDDGKGTYLINPKGGTEAGMGYHYGPYMGPNDRGPSTLWQGVANQQGNPDPMRPYTPGSSGTGASGTGGGSGGGGSGGGGSGGGGSTSPFQPGGGSYTPKTGSASPFKVAGSFVGPSATNIYGDPEYPTPPGVPGVPGNPLPIPEGQEAMKFKPYGEPVGEFTQQRSYGGLPRSIGPWGESGGYYGGNPYLPNNAPTLPTLPGGESAGDDTPWTTMIGGSLSNGDMYGVRPGDAKGVGYNPNPNGSVGVNNPYQDMYPIPVGGDPNGGYSNWPYQKEPDADTVFPHPGEPPAPYDPGDGPVTEPDLDIQYIPPGSTAPPPAAPVPPPTGTAPPPGGGTTKPGVNVLNTDGSMEALLAYLLNTGTGAE